ncbi:MAG TPA: hypothetical protein VFO99_20945 [Pyrinomonadaceae bacterium]|nr:hypothetical protein [Pyrinomonadaceae bacterium]
MTRNQKIALGCGGAGCLGLIVVAIAASLIYYFAYREVSYRASRDYNFNVNLNRNSNLNSNSNSESESESDSSNSNSVSSVADMSDDDKHKLFQAASMTGDTEIIKRVNTKLGLMNDDYTFSDDYQQFVRDHVTWVFQNTDFIQTVGTPEQARAYVDEHLPE